jgi:hypothetical protein
VLADVPSSYLAVRHVQISLSLSLHNSSSAHQTLHACCVALFSAPFHESPELRKAAPAPNLAQALRAFARWSYQRSSCLSTCISLHSLSDALTCQRLVRTRQFSDFTFKVPGGEDHKVHKLILSARSPVFGRFLQKHDKASSTTDLLHLSYLTTRRKRTSSTCSARKIPTDPTSTPNSHSEPPWLTSSHTAT